MKKSYKIIKKITGISCPFFGISWNPCKSDQEKIKNLLIFLEDRRVLFNAINIETPIWVSESIIEIRKILTDLIPEFDDNSETCEILRTMRSSCRHYWIKPLKINQKNI